MTFEERHRAEAMTTQENRTEKERLAAVLHAITKDRPVRCPLRDEKEPVERDNPRDVTAEIISALGLSLADLLQTEEEEDAHHEESRPD